MKSVSVGRLKDLEKEGWKITPADKNAITAQVGIGKAAVAIAVSLENIKDVISNIKIPVNSNDKEIEKIMTSNFELIKQLVSQTEPRIKTWEFDLQRGNNGLLTKVVANGK